MASPKYQNSKKEEWARWRRRDHANIEAMQNLVFEAVGEETAARLAENGEKKGSTLPPSLRAFISAVQSSHGGGEVVNEPFERSHATVAGYLQFTGTPEAKEQRVRRLINRLEEYQKLAGYRFLYIERGGEIVGEDKQGNPIYSATRYTDLLLPLADDGVMRARASDTWKKGTPATGGRPHPGLALAEQLPSVLAALPRVDGGPEKKTATVLSLTEYTLQREKWFVKAVEAYAEGVVSRGGDDEHELEKLEVLIARVRQSRHKTAAKQKSADEETRQHEADAPLWEGEEGLARDVTAHTAYKSESDEVLLHESPEELMTVRPAPDPPTNLTPSAGLSSDDSETSEADEPVMVEQALMWAACGIPVFPLHQVFDDICSCGCSPRKCKGSVHRCGSECLNKGKHPRTRNGKDDATTDPAQIRAWWAKWPHAPIGGRMGGDARVVVLDFDPKNGGDASLHDLIAAHGDGWLDTRTHLTGSLGRHFFFQYPEGVTLHNSAGEVGPGVDTRAEGGYVVLPPSLHASGRRYEVVHVAEVWPAPDWLLAVFLSEAVPPMVVDFQERRASRASVPSGPRFAEGERNTGLFGVGIGRWRHGWASTVADLRDQLREVNEGRCSPPLVDDEVVMLAEHIARDYASLRGVDAEGKGAA